MNGMNNAMELEHKEIIKDWMSEIWWISFVNQSKTAPGARSAPGKFPVFPLVNTMDFLWESKENSTRRASTSSAQAQRQHRLSAGLPAQPSAQRRPAPAQP